MSGSVDVFLSLGDGQLGHQLIEHLCAVLILLGRRHDGRGRVCNGGHVEEEKKRRGSEDGGED